MKLVTRHIPEKVYTMHPNTRLSVAQLVAIKEDLGDNWVGSEEVAGGYRYSYRVPAQDVTYAPTLAIVHEWFWSDWGPLHLNWKTGKLCPFNERVDRMNIRCVEGNRHNYCGFEVKDYVTCHLDENGKRRYTGRVTCHQWSHILTLALRGIPIEEQRKLPDDPSQAAFILLRRLYKITGYQDWWLELKRRKHKRKSEWLKGLSEHSL